MKPNLNPAQFHLSKIVEIVCPETFHQFSIKGLIRYFSLPPRECMELFRWLYPVGNKRFWTWLENHFVQVLPECTGPIIVHCSCKRTFANVDLLTLISTLLRSKYLNRLMLLSNPFAGILKYRHRVTVIRLHSIWLLYHHRQIQITT